MFVAEFIGSPAMNLVTLRVVDHAVALGDWSMPVPREITDTRAELVIGIRPEHLDVGGTGVEMQIDVVEELGADAYLYGRIAWRDNTGNTAIWLMSGATASSAIGVGSVPTTWSVALVGDYIDHARNALLNGKESNVLVTRPYQTLTRLADVRRLFAVKDRA